MNNQEAFDKIARHLLTQKRPAETNGECKYRGENGLRCAIGCLIPDEIYNEGMEGQRVENLLSETKVGPLLAGVTEGLLMDLQRVHDTTIYGAPPSALVASRWFRALKDVARAYELDAAVLNEFATNA